ncbi:MAG: GAF domain-containing protein [Anaerolineales bacterium]|nr:GAF domain-containing protein [Anaerolineales bacterium]
MQPQFDKLIQKHFGGAENLSPEVLNLLNDLEQDFNQSSDAGPGLNLLMDNMPFGITLIDYQKNIIHANQGALRMMGYDSLDEIKGHLCHDTLCPAEANRCPILDLKQKVDRSDRILITKDKQKIPILKSVTPIIYEGKEILLEAFVDISEKTELEKAREAAFEKRGLLTANTNTIIKNLAQVENPEALMTTLVDEIYAHFWFERVQYFAFNPVAHNLRVTNVAGTDAATPMAQRAVLPVNVGAVGKAAGEREIHVAEKLDMVLERHPQMLVPGIKAQVALPIMVDNNLVGVLDIQATDEQALDADTILFLEILSIQGGILLESLERHAEVVAQFNELNSLQKKASIEGWLEFGEVNPLSSSRYIFDLEQNEALPASPETSSNGEVISRPLEVRGTVIGSLGIAENPDQPLSEEEKKLIESVSSEVAEALERARLFESSQRSASELAVLNEMGATFAQALTEEFINETVYTYTSKLMTTPQFYIAYHDPEEDMIYFPMVVINGERITEDHPDYQSWAPRPAGTGLTGYIIDKRMPILIDSNAEETLTKLGLPFLKTGGETQSFLGVPMLIGDRSLGVISVQSDHSADLYGRHHLDLLTTIASQAAVSINNTRLFQSEQERAQQERTVRTITDKVRRGTDTQQIMQIALEELSRALNADGSTIQLGKPEDLLKTNGKPIVAETQVQTVETEEG